MAKPAARIAFLGTALALAGTAIVVRSVMLQVVEHRQWAAKAQALRSETKPILARRGAIFDRNGFELAESQELYHVSIALHELRDTVAMRALLPKSLGVSAATVESAFRNSYAYFYGPFSAAQVQPLRDVHGVHLEVLYNRVYPMEALAAPVLGHLDPSGDGGIEGIEKALDTLLAGHPGSERYTLDAKGNRLESPGGRLKEPVPGRDVYLTIDHDLQGIAEARLREAVQANQAHGGAVVIIDIHSGELLAVAALHTDSVTAKVGASASAMVEPFEPGSTSKLFTVAAVLLAGADTSPVSGHDGKWSMYVGKGKPRPIEDEHKVSGMLTLGEAVEYSSNIAMSEFSLRLTPSEQYEAIRSFGFGLPPGIGFPGEAAGKLPLPASWANPLYTKPSLAQGYEWETTPVQMATAYAAIANHGMLLTPALVREVHDSNGTVLWRHRADTVRRAVPDTIAQRLLRYLALATDSVGTGSKAQLDRFSVIGKTGTAVIAVGGKYGKGYYRASFAGIFPGDAPQWVVYVMIDRPRGTSYFGGTVAAPMVHDMLQQAVALRHTTLDDRQLAANAAAMTEPAVAMTTGAEPVRRVTLPLASAALLDSSHVAVPALSGTTIRDAVVALQRLGFEVRLVGRGAVRGTDPAAGETLPRGTTVTLRADTLP